MGMYKELSILIAEDDDGHAELIQEGLFDSGVRNEMIRFSNGEEIWDYLIGNGGKDVRDPNKNYIVLLDIKMPKLDGLELLKRIKTDDSMKEIPVIMLTTTDDPREVEACYQMGCNFYVIKPVDFRKFTETLRRLGLFIQEVKF